MYGVIYVYLWRYFTLIVNVNQNYTSMYVYLLTKINVNIFTKIARLCTCILEAWAGGCNFRGGLTISEIYQTSKLLSFTYYRY